GDPTRLGRDLLGREREGLDEERAVVQGEARTEQRGIHGAADATPPPGNAADAVHRLRKGEEGEGERIGDDVHVDRAVAGEDDGAFGDGDEVARRWFRRCGRDRCRWRGGCRGSGRRGRRGRSGWLRTLG